jgi:hypothetical protein
MSLEHDLRRAFRRKPVPPGFVERLLARLERPEVLPHAALLTRRAVPTTGWLAAAATIALVAIGGAQYYTYQQTVAEAARVQADIRLALQIAGEKLALVQRKLQEPHR